MSEQVNWYMMPIKIIEDAEKGFAGIWPQKKFKRVVTYDDYANLQAECDRLRKDLQRHAWDITGAGVKELYDERNALSSELSAIKSQQPVGYFIETGGEWEQVNDQFKEDSDVNALYALSPSQ